MIGWLIKLSVLTFQPLIVIYRRCNFVYLSSLEMYITLSAIVLSLWIPDKNTLWCGVWGLGCSPSSSPSGISPSSIRFGIGRPWSFKYQVLQGAYTSKLNNGVFKIHFITPLKALKPLIFIFYPLKLNSLDVQNMGGGDSKLQQSVSC